MVEPAAYCEFKPPNLTVEEATEKLSLKINGYPPELFAYIDFEDITKNKYFITSYGRVFTSYGRELFPEQYIPLERNNVYMRIDLSCTGYIKSRKFFVHRLVANAFIPITEDDIRMNRIYVNHKYNKDGRCNYVWNLEWVNDSENMLHGYRFNEEYDKSLFNPDILIDRRSEIISYDQFGASNPNSRISEFQAHLICHAYAVLHYSMRECAIYAWLEGNKKDEILVSSIVHGYCWHEVGIQYGIEPRKQIPRKRANKFREDKKDDYEKSKSKFNRKSSTTSHKT